MPDADRILIARVGAPNGLKGELRLIPFGDDPEALADYGPLFTADGRRLTLASLRFQGDKLIARFAGIADRTAAEKLTGVDLFIDRDSLPEPEEDEFYLADLIGLDAVLGDGAPFGKIIAVPNFGAGDLLDIAPVGGGQTVLIPFTRVCVPEIDIAAGRVVVDPPLGLIGSGPDDDADDDEGEEAEAGAPDTDPAR